MGNDLSDSVRGSLRFRLSGVMRAGLADELRIDLPEYLLHHLIAELGACLQGGLRKLPEGGATWERT